jgi:hypothetical protein
MKKLSKILFIVLFVSIAGCETLSNEDIQPIEKHDLLDEANGNGNQSGDPQGGCDPTNPDCK